MPVGVIKLCFFVVVDHFTHLIDDNFQSINHEQTGLFSFKFGNKFTHILNKQVLLFVDAVKKAFSDNFNQFYNIDFFFNKAFHSKDS